MNGLTTGSDFDDRSPLVPDVLTPAQYYPQRRGEGAIQPLKRLMMAVLEDALRCFQNGASATGSRRNLQSMEAEEWFCDTRREGPFSFESVCETLGVESGFLRRRVRQWRDQQLAGIVLRPLVRRAPVMRVGKISMPSRRRGRRLARTG